MLSPRKVRHRKVFKGKLRGTAQRGSSISFGEYALKATSSGKMTAQQIEAARVAINRKIKRGGKVWIRVFPDKPVTKKPAETRMGSGKGSTDRWVCKVKPGRVMFEVDGVSETIAREALRLGAMKLPVTTRIVAKEDW